MNLEQTLKETYELALEAQGKYQICKNCGKGWGNERDLVKNQDFEEIESCPDCL